MLARPPPERKEREDALSAVLTCSLAYAEKAFIAQAAWLLMVPRIAAS